MSEKKHNRKIDLRPFMYCVLSFFLAVILFLLSICVSLRMTFFSEDYMLQTMAENDYYSQLTDELRTQLTSLANASGLTSEFIDSFTSSMDIRQDVNNYVDAFYSGNSTVVDTLSFKQKFRSALDEYVEANKKEGTEVSESALEYLVNEAAEHYKNTIEIPFFSVAANFINKYNGPLNIAVIGMIIAAVVITALLFLTHSEFKHRGYRYVSYACLSAFLCTAVPPAIVFGTGVMGKINLSTRSLYNLFVNYFNGMFVYLVIFSAAFFVLGLISFFVFANKHNKLLNNH